MKTRSPRFIKRQQNAFLAIRNDKDLARLVEVPAYKLQLLAIKPQYHHFSIPKSDGSLRWIEEPNEQLKRVQRSLNHYLQAVYYFHGSEAAYGFVITAKQDPTPKNILTNAMQHLGCQWLYNTDIEDFFHAITWQKVFDVFSKPPFDFGDDLAQLLTSLCTHQERLPMGTPTSPVISNFVCKPLDEQLLTLSKWAQWSYTRFADDMSFSSQQAITKKEIQKIEALVNEYGFHFNPQKIWHYGPKDEKEVTGLRLAEQVLLPKGYGKSLLREITKLDHILEAQAQNGRKSPWIERYQQKVEGMLTFAAFVMGDDHPLVVQAEEKMQQALDVNVPDEFSAIRWMDFSYV